MELLQRFADSHIIVGHWLTPRLMPILAQPTGMSSAGFPYLRQTAWETFRDTVPHALAMGGDLLALVGAIEEALAEATDAEAENLLRACRVVRQIVHTAAITAPPNLWLLRCMLGWFSELGLIDRLLAGDALYPDCCEVFIGGESAILDQHELNADLHFLLSLGVVEQYEDSFRIAGHPRVRRVLERCAPIEDTRDTSGTWRRLFSGQELGAEEQEVLLSFATGANRRSDVTQNHWFPTAEEVELGYRLVPIVLGLRGAERIPEALAATDLRPQDLSASSPLCAASALDVLTCAGWAERRGERYRVTALGARGLSRGPGPFGIIHTYHPYMSRGRDILLRGRGGSWVSRGENVGASQDANRSTFEKANAALDRFCVDTGFELRVFIEHAIGRGEATRQRYELSAGKPLSYVGADLEDAAIDAAILEQSKGRLPPDMLFVRDADIGQPEILLDALQRAAVRAHGAVMIVGNGFHEVRGQTDASMVEMFRGYHDAGIILSFTEENALSIDDLRATGWNTYHAGFKYVHEKSGQGLRPAESRIGVRLGRALRAAWSECARAAGYVRLDSYCHRTRTVYPYTPRSGINPAISVNHFLVPANIASDLALPKP